VFVVERNTGHEASHLGRMLHHFHKVYSICQNDEDVPGWWTSETFKREAVENLRETFMQDAVFLSKDFVCENPFLEKHERETLTLKEFKRQLNRFQATLWVGDRPGQVPKVFYSGKVDGDGKVNHMFNDDFIMTLVLNCAVARRFLRKKISTVPSKIYQ